MVNLQQSNLETLECGIEIYTLNTLKDTRGSFTEIFRNSWYKDKHFLQWNYFKNDANILRGVHIHPIHTDYIIMLTGSMVIGLLDLRKQSSTYYKGYLIEISSEPKQTVMIPNGIAHGFYSKNLSSCIVGVDQYWQREDELGCHWQSTKNYIPWPCEKPILSPKDETEQSLVALQEQLESLGL